jgi:hypothetical protein
LDDLSLLMMNDMAGELSYRTLCAISALTQRYALGEIDRAEYDRLHRAISTDPRAERRAKLDRMADEIVLAVKQRIATAVKAADERHAAEIARLEGRIADLERRLAEPEAERRLRAV